MSNQYPEEALRRRSGDQRRPNDEDLRTPFAKDRDRLIYSDAFRSLAGKSQVVASTEIGPFHTRLTHSLKVAQLGRRLAEQLRSRTGGDHKSTKIPGKLSALPLAPDPDLVEFACLAHDLGHPPFGHTGERALHIAVDRLVARTVAAFLDGAGYDDTGGQVVEAQRVIGGFEGNPQSLRIITRLSNKSMQADNEDQDARYLGLDLTAAAIDAVSKYPRGRNTLNQRKWGAYGSVDDPESDLSILHQTRAFLEYGSQGPLIGEGAQQGFECQLMDWCDDVTYAVHDVEDFYMAGLIPLDRIFAYEDDLKNALASADQPSGSESLSARSGILSQRKMLDTDEWISFREYLRTKWAGTVDHFGDDRETSEEFLNGLRASLIIDGYGATGWTADNRSVDGRRYSHRRASDLISYFAGSCITCCGVPMLKHGTLSFRKYESSESEDACEREKEKMLRYQCDLLKELIWKYVIESPGLKTQQAGQSRIINDLVDIHVNDMSLIPPHFSEIAQYGAGYSSINGMRLPVGCLERLAEIRVAADYVASLTEPQAVALHKRLTGVELGGFRDYA